MKALPLLTELVQIPSFSPKKSALPEHYAACTATLDVLQREVLATGAKVLLREVFQDGRALWPVDVLIAEWKAGNPTETVVFSGHTDVMPVSGQDWTVDPFAAVVKDGFIFGRGTTDMKTMIAAFCTGIPEMLDGLTDYHIIAVFTTDEEEAGAGAYLAYEWMKKSGMNVDAVIVGEPSAFHEIGDSVRFGRRGSVPGTLAATGISGHIAYEKNFINPFDDVLLPAIIATKAVKFESDGKGEETTNLEFSSVQSGSLDIGGTIPEKAYAKFNIRFTANYTAQQLEDMIRASMAEHGVDLSRITLTMNTATHSVPYTSTVGRLVECARQAVKEVCGRDISLNRSGGTSDARHVHIFYPHAQIIELGTPSSGGKPDEPDSPLHATYGERGGLHQVDERAKLTDIDTIGRVYIKLIRLFFGAAA